LNQPGSQVVANVEMSDGSSPDNQINRINFSSSDSGVASIDPSQVIFLPVSYSTTITGESLGTAEISVVVTLLSGLTCDDPAPTQVTVNPFTGWFQTKEGDVHSGGSINSPIPSTATNPYFSLHDSGETSGVISYGGGSAFFDEGEISPEDDWLAKDSFSKRKFDYFYQLLGSPEANWDGGSFPNSSGIYYRGEGLSITVGRENVPNGRKLVILVDGDVTITDKVTVVPGGSLVLISSGNINVNGSVGRLEGIYLADGTFSTGDEDNQLTAEGVFIAQEFALERGSPGDPWYDTEPYEVFYYRPDLVINSHPKIWTATYTWQEIAP